jgi:hypothetical protein
MKHLKPFPICVFTLFGLLFAGCGEAPETPVPAKPVSEIKRDIENNPAYTDQQKALYSKQLSAREAFEANAGGQTAVPNAPTK